MPQTSFVEQNLPEVAETTLEGLQRAGLVVEPVGALVFSNPLPRRERDKHRLI
jgi:hypothetical protein